MGTIHFGREPPIAKPEITATEQAGPSNNWNLVSSAFESKEENVSISLYEEIFFFFFF